MFFPIKCHILLIYCLHLVTQVSRVQVCGLPQCSDFSVMLYVVLPAAVALVMVAVLLGVCCLRQTHKKPLSVAASSPRCDSFESFLQYCWLSVSNIYSLAVFKFNFQYKQTEEQNCPGQSS